MAIRDATLVEKCYLGRNSAAYLNATRIIGHLGCAEAEFTVAAKKLPGYDKYQFENAVRDLTVWAKREKEKRYELHPAARKVLRVVIGPAPDDPEYRGVVGAQARLPRADEGARAEAGRAGGPAGVAASRGQGGAGSEEASSEEEGCEEEVTEGSPGGSTEAPSRPPRRPRPTVPGMPYRACCDRRRSGEEQPCPCSGQRLWCRRCLLCSAHRACEKNTKVSVVVVEETEQEE